MNADHLLGTTADPLARADARKRTPEVKERKLAQLELESVAKLRRVSVKVRALAAIGVIGRAGSNAPVGTGIHVVPPEKLGAGKVGVTGPAPVPDLLPLHQVVRLLPHLNLSLLAGIPAIADNSMLRGQATGQHGSLGAAGHGRQHRCELSLEAVCGESLEMGHPAINHRGRQSDNIDNHQGSHENLARLS